MSGLSRALISFLALAASAPCSGCSLDFDEERLADSCECAASEVCQDGRCVVENAIVALALGVEHTLALDRSGSTWGFGRSLSGVLARESGAIDPALLDALPTLTAIASAGAEYFGHSCGISSERALFCWGTGSEGQLGAGEQLEMVTEPQLVSGGSTTWKSVVAGPSASCALGDDGAVWCWGLSYSGEVGLPPGELAAAPTRVGETSDWHAISLHKHHVCGIHGEQHLLSCWGQNDYGQLGRVGGNQLQPELVATDADGWAQVSAGYYHTCGVKLDGSLWCWGKNEEGQLGLEGADHDAPARVDDRSDWAQVSSGKYHTCATRSDHTLWCWGSADGGRVGSGAAPSGFTPLPIAEERRFVAVEVNELHSCAVAEDGTLWCWGSNSFRQAGQAEEPLASVPTEVQLGG
jgi:alpha-tubulin suppressor-like RCC1 family protein